MEPKKKKKIVAKEKLGFKRIYNCSTHGTTRDHWKWEPLNLLDQLRRCPTWSQEDREEEDPLRLKTSVIFPSNLSNCFRTINLGVLPGLENVFQILLQFYWGPQVSPPLPTLPHHCASSTFPSHFIRQLCSLVFSNFRFHWFSGRQIGFLKKKSCLTERKGTGIMFSEAQRT